MAAIAVKITILAGITSSAGTAFVSHEYTAHADHSAVSSAAPCQHPDPREVVFEEAGYLGEGEDRVEE
jgi:hypothetical protein